MALNVGTLIATLELDDKPLGQGIRSAEGTASKSGSRAGRLFSGGFTKGIAKLGGAIAGVFAVQKVVGFFKDSISAASDLNEAGTKLQQVFGDATGQVEDFAGKGAKQLGQSKLDVLDAAATFGVYGKAAGLAGKENAKFSTKFVRLATDLASFNNTSPEEAIEALASGLRGEAEPLRRYGVLLDDATLRQEAMRQGLIKTTKQALTPQQKVLAAQAVIMRQTKDAQGDFARTSGGLANQQRILAAQFEDVKGKVGQALLPVLVKLATFATSTLLPAIGTLADWISTNVVPALSDLGRWVGQNTDLLKTLAMVIGPVVAGWVAYTQVMKIARGAQKAFNLVMAANPIGLVIAALVALGIGLVLAYKKSETFRKIVNAAFNAVKKTASAVVGFIRDHWRLLLSILGGPVGAAVVLIIDHFGKIKSAVSAAVGFVKSHWRLILSILTGPIGAAVIFISGKFGAIRSGVSTLIGVFRKIPGWISGALRGLGGRIKDIIGGGITSAWNTVKSIAGSIVDKFAWLAEKIVGAGAKAFGWVPGLGGKLKDAERSIHEFRENANREINGIQSYKEVQIHIRTTGTENIPNFRPGGGPNFGNFATGGRPPVGVPSVVGERGPELFIPDAPGRIIPHRKTMAALSGGGGPAIQIGTYNDYGTATARDTAEQFWALSKARG